MNKTSVACAVMIINAATSVQAQPPERFRLDLGFGITIDPNNKLLFYPGRRAPQVGIAGADAIYALDVNATVNATEDLSFFAGTSLGMVYQRKPDPDDPPIVQAAEPDEDIEAGIGDVSVGASYALIGQGEYWPSVVVGLQGGIPTASPSSVQGYLGNRLYSLTSPLKKWRPGHVGLAVMARMRRLKSPRPSASGTAKRTIARVFSRDKTNSSTRPRAAASFGSSTFQVDWKRSPSGAAIR